MVVVGAPLSYLPRASIGQDGRAPIIRRCCTPDDVTAGLKPHPVRRPGETVPWDNVSVRPAGFNPHPVRGPDETG